MIRAWGSAAAWGLISAPTVWTPIEGVSYSVGGQRIGQYSRSLGKAGVAPRPGSLLEKLQNAYTDLISTVDPARARNQKLLEASRSASTKARSPSALWAIIPAPSSSRTTFTTCQETGIVASSVLGLPRDCGPGAVLLPLRQIADRKQPGVPALCRRTPGRKPYRTGLRNWAGQTVILTRVLTITVMVASRTPVKNLHAGSSRERLFLSGQTKYQWVV